MVSYGLMAFLPCAAVCLLGRVLPSLASRQGRLAEPDARGAVFVMGTLLGLLLGIGLASYTVVGIEKLPLLLTAVTLMLVMMVVLVAKYYLSVSTLGTLGVLLFVGLLPVIVKAGEYVRGSAAVVVGALILVPVGVSAAAYLISQLEGPGDAGVTIVALTALCGIAYLKGEGASLAILLTGLGAMVPVLGYAGHRGVKTVIGELGTFALGVLMALAAITGELAFPAAIVFIPYVVNLVVKVEGRSLAQVLAKATHGRLPSAFLLVAVEMIFALIAVLIYV